MVAYAFPAEAAEDIAHGIRTFTLLIPRTMPSRHARVREDITLRPGGVTKKPFHAVCVGRATVHLSRAGIQRVTDTEIASDEAAAVIALFAHAEDGAPRPEQARDRLAVRLGHGDYADFYAEEIRRPNDRGALRGGRLVRELLVWELTDSAAQSRKAA